MIEFRAKGDFFLFKRGRSSGVEVAGVYQKGKSNEVVSRGGNGNVWV